MPAQRLDDLIHEDVLLMKVGEGKGCAFFSSLEPGALAKQRRKHSNVRQHAGILRRVCGCVCCLYCCVPRWMWRDGSGV